MLTVVLPHIELQVKVEGESFTPPVHTSMGDRVAGHAKGHGPAGSADNASRIRPYFYENLVRVTGKNLREK